jgi:hypothetical protein
VITYTLMVGRFPFMAESLQALQHAIQYQEVNMATEDWEVSPAYCCFNSRHQPVSVPFSLLLLHCHHPCST